MPNITIENIDEADLRVALWMSNSGKTKKSICEYLKIKYNTTRLTKILTQFQEALANQEVQKKAAKKKIFTDEEKDIIARRYLEVNSMAKVAEEYYVSSARIKAILIEKQVPIKGRKSILVDHIHQDLDTAFSVGHTVFSKIHKSKCLIERKYDESYVEYLKNGSIKTVDNPYVKDEDSRDGVNYYVYWILDDGTNMGLLSSVEALIKSIENTLIKEGQEFYRVKIQNSEGDDYFGFCKRGDLYKI
jgi:hypothetical protein